MILLNFLTHKFLYENENMSAKDSKLYIPLKFQFLFIYLFIYFCDYRSFYIMYEKVQGSGLVTSALI
jgi:hypothetical protein